jgi:arylsulfatase A-like enzyme
VRPARIVLVSMDTVRADRADGSDAAATPALAAIAAQGVRFTRFYAASSYTMPSHMSIWTGLDPAEHGVHASLAELAREVPTLPELLRAAGFRTMAFHEGGYVAARFGFARGFERYVELPRAALVGPALEGVTAWMREHAAEPYFLFLHTYAAHYPYGGLARYRAEHPERGLPDAAGLAALRERHALRVRRGPGAEAPPEERLLCSLLNQLADSHAELLDCGDTTLPPDFVRSPHFEDDRAAIERSYVARIALVDRALATLRDVLRDSGQWDDTLVVVTSDHGEAFFEHGLYKHEYVPFDEVLRVPLVASWPRGLGTRARVVDGLAWHLDLLPTLLGLAGVPPPPGLGGRDLRGVLLGKEEIPSGRAIFPAVLRLAHEEPRPLRRVALEGPLKWIAGQPEFGDAQGFVFDLASDPGERRNLRAERAGDAHRLEERAHEWERGLVPRPPVDQRDGRPLAPDAHDAPPALPEEERERLRVLGYLDG